MAIRWRSVASALVLAVLAFGSPADVGAQGADELSRRQVQAQRQQEALRQRIASLQQRIETRESDRKEAADALRQSERAISELNRRLAELLADIAQTRTEIDALSADIARRSTDLTERRAALAKQMRAQYAAGLSPWTALLSGDDPQETGRQLSYLDYVSKARAADIDALERDVARLAMLREREQKRRTDLQGMQQETSQRQAELRTQQQEHALVLARLEGQIKAQRAEAGRLDRDDQRLTGLVSDLAQQVTAARQEEARLAAEAAKQEAARQEAARQEAARQQAAQQKAEAAKQAAARQQAAQRRLAAQPPPQRSAPPIATPPLQEARGLRADLPMPVRGRVLARFGTARPDGGNWRGILLGAPEGTQVKVVGAGTVVYADWLRGFGNLLIVDHGQQFMSVYAHNQGLLKKVGDVVRVGDAIATVGATGGQVESGLYFEIRHRGVPQDPGRFLRAEGS